MFVYQMVTEARFPVRPLLAGMPFTRYPTLFLPAPGFGANVCRFFQLASVCKYAIHIQTDYFELHAVTSMFQECIGGWLQSARSCALCRKDLVQLTNERRRGVMA